MFIYYNDIIFIIMIVIYLLCSSLITLFVLSVVIHIICECIDHNIFFYISIKMTVRNNKFLSLKKICNKIYLQESTMINIKIYYFRTSEN